MSKRKFFITLGGPFGAEELEDAIGEYLSGDTDYASRDIRNVLRTCEVPKPIQASLFSQLDSLGEDITYLSSDVTRDNVDAVADGLKRLEAWLDARFNVHNPKSKKPHRFCVWS